MIPRIGNDHATPCDPTHLLNDSLRHGAVMQGSKDTAHIKVVIGKRKLRGIPASKTFPGQSPLFYALINQFLRSEPISTTNVIVSAFLTIILSVFITFIAIKLYEGERIIK